MSTPRADAPRSLAEDLRARDDAALAALLRDRADLVHPLPGDLAALAARATGGPTVARELDRLDRLTLQVVEVLAVLPEPATTADVIAAFRGADQDAALARAVEAALARLHRRALVWGGPTAWHLVRSARHEVGPEPCGLAPAARTSPRVEGYARDPAALDDVLAAAPAAAREVLDLLAAGPPTGRVARADRVTSPERARTPVEWLLARDLLLPSGPDLAVIPRAVALHLRGGLLVPAPAFPPPAPAAATAHDVDEVDRTSGQHAFLAIRAVSDLLDDWAVQPPRRLRSGGVAVRDLAAAARRLDTDEATAALWLEVAHAAGLLRDTGAVDATWLPTTDYDGWLARDPAARWAVLADAWLRTRRVASLVGTRDERDGRVNALAAGAARAGAPATRRLLLGLLAAQPPGTSLSAADACALVDDRVPRRASAERDAFVAATLREAELLGVTGRGAISGPGRALLADDASAVAEAGAARGPVAGRRKPAPAAAAALALVLPDPLEHVLLQADLTAVAPGPLRADLARELALLADVESTGGATVYRFSAASVRRALDAGRDGAGLLAFLGEHARTPVPQPLRYLIEDVARRHGAIRVGRASAYVRCDDPATLSAVLADRRCAGLGLVRLAPTVLAASAAVPELLAALRAAGLAPMAESPDGSVLVRRPQEQRAPDRPSGPAGWGSEPAEPPDEALLAAAVRALRAGDRAATAPRGAHVEGPAGSAGAVPPRGPMSETLEALRTAARTGSPVWLGYADDAGLATGRVVDPIRLAAGQLTGFDHRSGQVRTFTVSRITGVAPLTDEGRTTPHR